MNVIFYLLSKLTEHLDDQEYHYDLVHRGNHVMWYHLGIKRRENVVISDHIANAVSYTYHCRQEYLLDQHVQVDHRYLSLPVLQESLQEENSNIIIFRYLEQ